MLQTLPYTRTGVYLCVRVCDKERKRERERGRLRKRNRESVCKRERVRLQKYYKI